MTVPNKNDIRILRELARRYLDLCHAEENQEKRRLWRRHNALEPTRPLVLALTGTPFGASPQNHCEVEDEFLRLFERDLRRRIYQASIGDDTVLEPWLVHRASMVFPGGDAQWWGVPFERKSLGDHMGWRVQPPIEDLDEISRLVQADHAVDERQTRREASKLRDALGDILPVVVDRSSIYQAFPGDLSTDVGYLRGVEQLMWDMMDNPEWFHRLMGFLRNGVLRNHRQCEEAGHWRFHSHNNQSVPYAEDLPDPAAESPPVGRDQLWWFMASQEFAQVSPGMQEEFLVRYQKPIMERFGLGAYGCCEDLTNKIDILRQIENLRRIAVTPWANVARCAEQIGTDYVCSWRPSPAMMVCTGFDEERIRRTTREALTAFRDHGCIVDITLKDVHTVQGEHWRVREWTRIVRECAEDY